MSKFNILGFTYEADIHCEYCTSQRFGPACQGTDNEGNEVNPIFTDDEWWEPSVTGRQVLMCSDCGEELDETGTPDMTPR